ncbi:hypothetical protein AWZ03_012479 [Drosophila navojoa]|uniref:Uncharacterized protein n=1 Tax=Drosophila navojoa TaxID=7232 RepID=A0A484AWW7_DRONA|nr:hypothetical protein AWZ03_012479 [Drosophila navojoa]
MDHGSNVQLTCHICLGHGTPPLLTCCRRDGSVARWLALVSWWGHAAAQKQQQEQEQQQEQQQQEQQQQQQQEQEQQEQQEQEQEHQLELE